MVLKQRETCFLRYSLMKCLGPHDYGCSTIEINPVSLPYLHIQNNATCDSSIQWNGATANKVSTSHSVKMAACPEADRMRTLKVPLCKSGTDESTLPLQYIPLIQSDTCELILDLFYGLELGHRYLSMRVQYLKNLEYLNLI